MPSQSRLRGEFELVARYLAPLAERFAGACDLRDEAAVITPTPGREFVVITDTIVAGVHFNVGYPAELVARNALRANLSDLAAKGTAPRGYLLDLLLPGGTAKSFVAAFCADLAADRRDLGLHLIGGDTNRTPRPLTVAVWAFGHLASNRRADHPDCPGCSTQRPWTSASAFWMAQVRRCGSHAAVGLISDSAAYRGPGSPCPAVDVDQCISGGRKLRWSKSG